MAAAGGVVGGVAGHYLGRPISKGDLKELGEKLPPDSSAFLLLLEDVYSEDVIDSMAGYNANVVTLTIGSELSGQIASVMAVSEQTVCNDIDAIIRKLDVNNRFEAAIYAMQHKIQLYLPERNDEAVDV